ncbi:MAG TPA: hypothetical protein PKC03_03355 [Dokdonella sp.]|jgi:hypothetical protein|nr:hypothetical protein [Dokdonella sp.]
MTNILPCAIPEEALLLRYRREGHYADCYMAEVYVPVRHAEFVEAFYTTWLFGIERFILKWAVRRPSTDEDARQLGLGNREEFAAWRVEGRTGNQLLLCDYTGRTRSWLMTSAVAGTGQARTRLHFGSAVVPRIDALTGAASMGSGFNALLGFHRLYSRLLLRAACANLPSR